MSDLSDSNEDGGQMAEAMKKAFNNGAAEKATRDALKLLKGGKPAEPAATGAGHGGTVKGKRKQTEAEMEAELIALRKQVKQRQLNEGTGDPVAVQKEQIVTDITKASAAYFGAIMSRDPATASTMLFSVYWMARSVATSACYRGRTLDRMVRKLNVRIKHLEGADAEGSEMMDLISDLPFAKDGKGGVSSQEADGPEITVSALTKARQTRSNLELDRVTVMAVLKSARAVHDRFAPDAWEAPDRRPADGVTQPGDMFGFGK